MFRLVILYSKIFIVFIIFEVTLLLQVSTGHVSTLPQFIVAELFDQWGIDGFLEHTAKTRQFYRKVSNYSLQLYTNEA